MRKIFYVRLLIYCGLGFIGFVNIGAMESGNQDSVNFWDSIDGMPLLNQSTTNRSEAYQEPRDNISMRKELDLVIKNIEILHQESYLNRTSLSNTQELLGLHYAVMRELAALNRNQESRICALEEYCQYLNQKMQVLVNSNTTLLNNTHYFSRKTTHQG